MVDVFCNGLLTGVPCQCAERLPTHPEKIVFRLHHGIAVQITRFEELTIDLPRRSEEDTETHGAADKARALRAFFGGTANHLALRLPNQEGDFLFRIDDEIGDHAAETLAR